MLNDQDPRIDDSYLVRLAKSGDLDAFGILYDRYADGIYRFVYVHLSETLEAEDLTSEVFLRAWKHLPKYKEQGHPFSAFLFKIARNAIIDYRRKLKPKINRAQELLESTVNHSLNPGSIIENSHERQLLNATINHLQEDYRLVLVLRFINGLSPREVAEIMGRSEGAIRVLQFRALKAIRRKWDLIEKEDHEKE